MEEGRETGGTEVQEVNWEGERGGGGGGGGARERERERVRERKGERDLRSSEGSQRSQVLFAGSKQTKTKRWREMLLNSDSSALHFSILHTRENHPHTQTHTHTNSGGKKEVKVQ